MFLVSLSLDGYGRVLQPEAKPPGVARPGSGRACIKPTENKTKLRQSAKVRHRNNKPCIRPGVTWSVLPWPTDGGGVRERDRACETNTLKNLTAPCKPALPRARVDVRRWRPQPATCSDCRCGCIMIIFQSTIAQHCRAVGLPTLGPLKLAARTVCALTTCLQSDPGYGQGPGTPGSRV